MMLLDISNTFPEYLSFDHEHKPGDSARHKKPLGGIHFDISQPLPKYQLLVAIVEQCSFLDEGVSAESRISSLGCDIELVI